VPVASFTLAELLIVAAAEAWRDDGEVLASGIGLLPRLAAGLAKLTFNQSLMMTDGEAYLVAEPIRVGARHGAEPIIEGWMPYARTFDLLWSGKRHAMVGPVQVDRFGQSNISVIGDYAKPKTALIGVRGYPGNSISHSNSYFVQSHSRRVFVAGEVDMVGGIGYNPARWPRGEKPAGLDLRLIVSDLAVLDFAGPSHQIRVRSLHPGVTFEQVQDSTGFELFRHEAIPTTPPPTEAALHIIRERLDPDDQRASVFKGNPPGDRKRTT
jgi:glutaconate CoA-transferase, subunit B